MTSIEPASSNLSLSEIDEAISTISDAGWIRLRKVTNIYSRGRINPDDLLQEAFLSVIEGRRKCPQDIDILQILAGAMRSLASSGFKSMTRKPELYIISSDSDEDKPSLDPISDRSNAEEEVISDQESTVIKAAILSLFEGDDTAQLIVEGDMEGMDGKEIHELTALDKKAYASKRRLIRRRIERAYPEGWKQ